MCSAETTQIVWERPISPSVFYCSHDTSECFGIYCILMICNHRRSNHGIRTIKERLSASVSVQPQTPNPDLKRRHQRSAMSLRVPPQLLSHHHHRHVRVRSQHHHLGMHTRDPDSVFWRHIEAMWSTGLPYQFNSSCRLRLPARMFPMGDKWWCTPNTPMQWVLPCMPIHPIHSQTLTTINRTTTTHLLYHEFLHFPHHKQKHSYSWNHTYNNPSYCHPLLRRPILLHPGHSTTIIERQFPEHWTSTITTVANTKTTIPTHHIHNDINHTHHWSWRHRNIWWCVTGM